MEKYKKILSQVVNDYELDHNVEKNIEYGHTIISIVPLALEPDVHGYICVSKYKILMLDCRFTG